MRFDSSIFLGPPKPRKPLYFFTEANLQNAIEKVERTALSCFGGGHGAGNKAAMNGIIEAGTLRPEIFADQLKRNFNVLLTSQEL